MGGLGLNSGIHDAVDLSIRLIRIVNGADRKAELDKYSDARRRVAVEYVKSISEKKYPSCERNGSGTSYKAAAGDGRAR